MGIAAHLGTSEDRGSRAAYGYIYLIDSMIRPPLMVFGFFFASVAIIAVGTILNSLFGAALVNAAGKIINRDIQPCRVPANLRPYVYNVCSCNILLYKHIFLTMLSISWVVEMV